MSDKLVEQCGLFGVHGHPDAVALTVRGLCALQHRGQESAGLAYPHGTGIEAIKVMGASKTLIGRLDPTRSASSAVGHVRYGTSGPSAIEYAQPFVEHAAGGQLAFCHNGHIADFETVSDARDAGGEPPGALNDSAMLAGRVRDQFTGDIAAAVQRAFRGVTPAYSVLILTNDAVCALRDPLAMRPLSLGRLGDATVFSSETCALDTIGATYVRDVEPGEMVLAQGGHVGSLRLANMPAAAAHCFFELIYFARPDSVMFGHSVAEFRTRLGARLAREAPAPGDVVVPVPDSAVHGGVGYAHASGVELAMALHRNTDVGRSFIEPRPAGRTATLTAKLHPIPSLIRGRRVILVDDSIVRGNTCLHLVRLLRQAGAREVHVRVTSPPVISSCHFGIDTPDDGELFAARQNASDMKSALGVDSLEFLSLEGLYAVAAPMRGFCIGCFSGVYPIEIPKHGAATWVHESSSCR